MYCIDAIRRIVTKSLYRTALPFSILNERTARYLKIFFVLIFVLIRNKLYCLDRTKEVLLPDKVNLRLILVFVSHPTCTHKESSFPSVPERHIFKRQATQHDCLPKLLRRGSARQGHSLAGPRLRLPSHLHTQGILISVCARDA